jgi:DNA mismatch repair protein MutL
VYHGAVPRVQLLPDDLINRIAAGEVVERPASVVKELVENSLDAASQRVEVELKAGGRALVRVADDGSGMDPDDVLLAIERHATSKITCLDDLQRLATMGFRGEALPSIAAVSRFELSSCADPSVGGSELRVDGGRILGAEPQARARGTTVTVRDLFFNTPARQKFLASAETELRHASEAVAAQALARSDVAFVLRHGSRTLIDAPPATDLLHRLSEVEPRLDMDAARTFAVQRGRVRVEGVLVPSSRARRPSLSLLVNGRPVRDRLLVGAVLRVVRSAGAGYAGSRVVVTIELPADEVDVNVHPAKAEVRFARSGQVFAAVEQAVREGVTVSHGMVGVRKVVTVEPSSPEASAVAPGSAAYPHRRSGDDVRSPSLFRHPAYAPPEDPSAGPEPRAFGAAQPGAGGGRAARTPGRAGARPDPADTPFGRLLGQYSASFLVVEGEEGLVIVDQHVAHERVLYDRIRERLEGAPAPSQRLLEPLLLELDEARVGALDAVREILDAVGIEADRFAEDTVRVSSVPTDVHAGEVARVVEELLGRATELDGVPERVHHELAEELAASLACRGAITINQRLEMDEQRQLLADLAGTHDPFRCPHGRPIVLTLGQDEMERRLGRH